MFKDSLDIYNRNLLKIILLGLVLVVPVSIFCFQAIFYVFQEVDTQYANIYAALITLINFTLLYPPFIRIALSEVNDEESSTLRELIKEFVNGFGMIIIFTLALFTIAVWGIVLIVPSIICVILLILFPLFIDQKKVSHIFKNIGNVLIKENFFILIDLLIILSINLLAWSGITFLLSSFDNNFYVYVISRSLINAALFPLIYIYLTLKYKNGGEELYV